MCCAPVPTLLLCALPRRLQQSVPSWQLLERLCSAANRLWRASVRQLGLRQPLQQPQGAWLLSTQQGGLLSPHSAVRHRASGLSQASGSCSCAATAYAQPVCTV